MVSAVLVWVVSALSVVSAVGVMVVMPAVAVTVFAGDSAVLRIFGGRVGMLQKCGWLRWSTFPLLRCKGSRRHVDIVVYVRMQKWLL